MKTFVIRHSRLIRRVIIAVATALTAVNIVTYTVGAADGEAASSVAQRYGALFDSPKPSSQPSGKSGAPASQPAADPRIERICKRSLFSPPEPKAEFKVIVSGVLGDTAYLDGGAAVQVGSKHNGAEVTAVGPDWVELAVEGKPKKFYVFTGGASATGAPSPGGPSRGGPARAMMASTSPGAGGGSGKFPPEMLAKAKKRFAALSPEQKAEAMAKMPPELRKHMTE